MAACHEKKQPTLLVRGARAGESRHPKGGGGTSRRNPVDDGCNGCMPYACFGVIILALLFSIVAPVWYSLEMDKSLEYSVAITGVSGLDPVTDLKQGHGLLSPEFNLTIGIASPSAVKAGCIQPRTSVTVSYSHLRIPMAAGRVPEMCAGAWRSSKPRQVVVRGHDVSLPGFMVDSLAEDMRRGDAMFEVILASLEPENENDQQPWKIVTCWAKLGDATGTALKILCDVTWAKQDSSYVLSAVSEVGRTEGRRFYTSEDRPLLS